MGEATKVFVGNLPYKCNNDDLYNHFCHEKTVEDAIVITDRETGRSRGFGFVTFSSESEARAAIDELHGSDLMGRDITVSQAETKSGGGRGSYGGGRRGGGGYGSGGYKSGSYGGEKRYQGGQRFERNDYYGGRSDGGSGGYRSRDSRRDDY